MLTRSVKALAFASALAAFAVGTASAATGASKDEAVAMVKKAVDHIKAEGPDKAYKDIDNKAGSFVDRDLYIVVYGLDGMVLAHGADPARIGTNQLAAKDPDGKEFVKERVALAKKQTSFWQQYKFPNPVTNTIEPKEMYCERLNATVVYSRVYQF